MRKHKNYAEVNTSYTTFFLVSTLGAGIFFSNLFTETKHQSLIVIILYVLLLYFAWDFIKQLYYPGQAMLLYTIIFLVMPFAMDRLLDFPYARLGTIILLGSYITAGILEILYEGVIKQRMNKDLFTRAMSIDNGIDRSIIKISKNQVYLTQYKGFVFAISLATIYFTLTYMLFHR